MHVVLVASLPHRVSFRARAPRAADSKLRRPVQRSLLFKFVPVKPVVRNCAEPALPSYAQRSCTFFGILLLILLGLRFPPRCFSVGKGLCSLEPRALWSRQNCRFPRVPFLLSWVFHSSLSGISFLFDAHLESRPCSSKLILCS